MTTSRKTLLIATLILSSCLGGAVLADDNGGGWWPQWGMGRGMMGGWGSDGGMTGYGPDTVIDRIDGRLAFLKTQKNHQHAIRRVGRDGDCHPSD